jgi:hypothetical protein
MLADLSTKSHPQARLTTLRKMWSIEKMYPDEVVESTTEKSEEETPKIRVKMIRAKIEGEGNDELEEIGYKLGSRANACVRKLDQDLAQLEEEEKILNNEYEKVKNISKGDMTIELSMKTAEDFEIVLMKQLRLISVYERAYTEELLLRMRSVEFLRKHERIKFGSVKDIVDTEEYDIDPFMTIPKTPQEVLDKDKTKEELPWYWKDEYDNKVPRTPPYEIRDRPSSSSKNHEVDEGTQKRLQEWKDAADADRKASALWVPFEVTEEGHRQADEAYKKRIEWKKWFETNQEALMRIESEQERKKEKDDLQTEVLKWKNSIMKDKPWNVEGSAQSSGGAAQSSGGAEQSSEGVSLTKLDMM